MRQEIDIFPSETSTLTKIDANLFEYKHAPFKGLLALQSEKASLIIPVMTMELSDPKSVPLWREVQVGDVIHTKLDLKEESWKSWDPPKGFLPDKEEYQFKVMHIEYDSLNYPIIAASEI